jgi:hypothetical protein
MVHIHAFAHRRSGEEHHDTPQLRVLRDFCGAPGACVACARACVC